MRAAKSGARILLWTGLKGSGGDIGSAGRLGRQLAHRDPPCGAQHPVVVDAAEQVGPPHDALEDRAEVWVCAVEPPRMLNTGGP